MSATKDTKPATELPPIEQIADAIVAIGAAMKAINASRLKRETLVTLIHDSSKVAKGTIRLVLNNLDAIEETFLKPKPATKPPGARP